MDEFTADFLREMADYAATQKGKGYLDEQFEQLQNETRDPDFVFQVVSLFFDESERLLDDISKALDQIEVDFKKVYAYVHQLKGSSSRIGACRVRKDCDSFLDYCKSGNIEGCRQCLTSVMYNFRKVEKKLKTWFKFEKFLLKYIGSV